MVNLKWERLVGFKWNGMRKKVRKVGVKVISVAKVGKSLVQNP